MTTLYLVRHGETIDNVNQIMQGQTQGQLTENGIRQAEEVRDQMANEHFSAIISSDLRRSADTAKIIAEPHHIEVIQISLLRERDWAQIVIVLVLMLVFLFVLNGDGEVALVIDGHTAISVGLKQSLSPSLP